MYGSSSASAESATSPVAKMQKRTTNFLWPNAVHFHSSSARTASLSNGSRDRHCASFASGESNTSS